jgi:hypothetical protein
MTQSLKRIIIICEGLTEKEFCIDVLQPYFTPKNIQIQTPLIKKSGGGIVAWSVLKKQIESHLRSDTVAIVTSLMDYYGIYEKHGYPSWEEAHMKSNKAERMDILEQGMYNEIAEDIRYRFIPYIQLHEFEGLLFTDINVFKNNFLPYEFCDSHEFEAIFRKFSNPEDINDNPNTAPSKRLEHHIIGYNKPVYGAMLAHETGLKQIRNKCPRFNNWIAKIESCQ